MSCRTSASSGSKAFRKSIIDVRTISERLGSIAAAKAAPFMGFAIDLIHRFLPEADQRTLVMAAVWLMGQCHIFIRYREQLASPPVSLALDEPTVEKLSALVSGWALAGLAQAEGAPGSH
jgi:hypothetical protein